MVSTIHLLKKEKKIGSLVGIPASNNLRDNNRLEGQVDKPGFREATQIQSD